MVHLVYVRFLRTFRWVFHTTKQYFQSEFQSLNKILILLLNFVNFCTTQDSESTIFGIGRTTWFLMHREYFSTQTDSINTLRALLELMFRIENPILQWIMTQSQALRLLKESNEKVWPSKMTRLAIILGPV